MNEKFYTSSALAKLVGVSTDTLRHYERKGVLARVRRGPNGYREYSHEALARVQLIRRALAVGFTLDELAGILKARDHGGSPCAEVRQLAAVKLAEVETRIKELKQLQTDLRATLKDWDSRLSERSNGERAHLLEHLPHVSRNKIRVSGRSARAGFPPVKKEKK